MPPATLEIAGLLALAALVWLVWDSLRAREAAVAAARSACSAEQLQFLDDTVAIQSVLPARNSDGHLRLRRIYGFEYSDTGNCRHPGTIVMLGPKVLIVRLGATPARPPLRVIR
ncbi:MAG: DUF3301 domain-containing protein [Burkholderiales bacterium]|nr:DUF3301 domain-containing protein [Burkholderiales bacterium]